MRLNPKPNPRPIPNPNTNQAAVAEPEGMVPRLAKQKAFCSSKHGDDDDAAVPARGQAASLLSNSQRLSGGGQA